MREFGLTEREADLAPMLSDFSDLVILEVIRAYGALKTRSAAGPLVKLIQKPHEESEHPERIQDAANDALELITGVDKGYDPADPDEAKKREAIDSWRLWWEKNKATWK